MSLNLRTILAGAAVTTAGLLAASPARAAVSAETAFVFNTFSFLVAGFLVMFMAAGFAMLEAGLVRTKNTATICLKNIALYAVAGIMYYVIGYNLMYTDVSGYIGSFSIFYDSGGLESLLFEAAGAVSDASGGDDAAALAAAEARHQMVLDALLGGITAEQAAQDPALAGLLEELGADSVDAAGYSIMSDWLFQMVFVAATASIISGTLAERIKLWPFLIFVVVLTGIIYPIQGSWTWGGGWLSAMGFSDFAGSTIVHSVGGWAALVGAIILGPRRGKYGPDGKVNPIPGANLPLSTLGTFILWLGWFGFNGGSQLALGSALDATAMSIVYANTNMAAAAGVVVAMLLTQAMYGKVDLTMALNGALAGLVAITAGPDVDAVWKALIVGGIGGGLVVFAVPFLDRLKIDDVVGAISVHLVAGIWGTIAVAIFGSGSFITQIVGILAVGVFVSVLSGIVWVILNTTMGIRVSEEEELMGLDRAECGLEAYPEFGSGSQRLA